MLLNTRQQLLDAYQITTSQETGMADLDEDNLIEFPLECDEGAKKLTFEYSRGSERQEEDDLYLKVLELAWNGDGGHLKTLKDDIAKFPSVIKRLDNHQGATPLHYAAQMGHLCVVKLLVYFGADVNAWDGNIKVTPLICASAHGRLDVIHYLLESGADVDAGLNSTITSSPLVWAVRKMQSDVVHFLLQSGASQISAMMYSETPIHIAVMKGCPDIIEMLLDAKGKPDLCMGQEKTTPLHVAASGEYPNALECCKILLEKGKMNVNVINSRRETPLHIAGKSFDADIVRCLVSHKAHLEALDIDKRTPLYCFINDNKYTLECIEVLINAKCNVNHKDGFGYTPLHIAAFKESSLIAELLLMNGADFSLRSENGITALSLLLRKIPSSEDILNKVLSSAVSLSKYDNEPTQHCKVKVNFNVIIPSSSAAANPIDSMFKAKNENRKAFYRETSPTIPGTPYGEPQVVLRPETTKIKCLIDEDQERFLLHPVIEAFLTMKWQKAKPIFITIFTLKAVLVLLFSAYVQMPYSFGNKMEVSKAIEVINANQSILNVTSDTNGTLIDELTNKGLKHSGAILIDSKSSDTPVWYIAMYWLTVVLTVINAVIELAQLIRAPRSNWISGEPWIFVIVLILMWYALSPFTWTRNNSAFHRSLAAVAICLSWIDLWIYMGRFPAFGLSIRIFFKVLHNFINFMIPHICLFAGFILAFVFIFPENREFANLPLAIFKSFRIMAGDITIPAEATTTDSKILFPITGWENFVVYYVMVITYTMFEITVCIVLMNLLIGLAVNDIQGLYADATMHRLRKQTILINTMESNVSAKWISSWLPKKIFIRYFKLFGAGQSPIVTFKPYDSRDTKLSCELKKGFVDLDSKRSLNEPSSGKNNRRVSTKFNDEQLLIHKMEQLIDKVQDMVDQLEKKGVRKKSSVNIMECKEK